jgi:hypothetical protein
MTRHTWPVGDLWARLVGWGRRLVASIGRHKVVAGVLTAGFGAVVAAFWSFVIDTATDKITGDKAPVGVTVLVGYSELGYQLALPGEPPVGDWSAKSQDALGVVGWAKSHGGAELNVVRRRLVLTGGSQTVVVVGLKGRVVGHHQALPVVVDLSKFGALSNVSAASIDLDAADPIAVKLPDEEAGSLSTSGAPKSEPFFARQTLSLVSNEPATSGCRAAAATATSSWCSSWWSTARSVSRSSTTLTTGPFASVSGTRTARRASTSSVHAMRRAQPTRSSRTLMARRHPSAYRWADLRLLGGLHPTPRSLIDPKAR